MCHYLLRFLSKGEPGVPGVTVIQADTRTCTEIPRGTRSPRYKRFAAFAAS
jgi:hypothetical protein